MTTQGVTGSKANLGNLRLSDHRSTYDHLRTKGEKMTCLVGFAAIDVIPDRVM